MILGGYISAIGADPVTVPGGDVYVGSDLIVVGDEPQDLTPDTLLLDDAVTLDVLASLVRVGAYVDGLGAGGSPQPMRAVVYRGDKLFAVGDEINITEGQLASWVTLPLPPLQAAPADYQFGIHVGGGTNSCGRLYLDPANVTEAVPLSLGTLLDGETLLGAGGLVETLPGGPGGLTTYAAVPYVDGPPEMPTGGTHDSSVTALMFLEVVLPLTIPSGVDDDYIATLPFNIAQREFLAGAVDPASEVSAVCGWFGTSFDPRTGTVAIVRSDGALADLVGERILVSTRATGDHRSVAVYVTDERTFPDELVDEDLLLSARAFLAIGNLGLDDLAVTVGILA